MLIGKTTGAYFRREQHVSLLELRGTFRNQRMQRKISENQVTLRESEKNANSLLLVTFPYISCLHCQLIEWITFLPR